MDFNKKKGFTLVELVVVIAVIAVLAVVLIPTFANLIRKANISNDTSLVKNLNIALQAESATTLPITPTDAVEMVAKDGYTVEKLTPRTNDTEIVWDSENNQFALVEWKDNAFSVIYSEKSLSNSANRIWIFRSQIDDVVNKGYSVYLKSDFKATNATVKAGLDVGENQNIDVTYDRKNVTTVADGQTAVIRTNGGNLTVNAPADNVDHYGQSTNVNIIAIAGNSYHEKGVVTKTMTIQSGHVELQKDAYVNTIVMKAKATSQTNNASVTMKTGSETGSVVVNTKAASVAIEQNAKIEKVVAGEGIISEVAAGETLEQAISNTVSGAGKTQETIVATVADENANYVEGGLGTKDLPYLVKDQTQLEYVYNLICKIVNNRYSIDYKYIRLTNDIVIDNNLQPQKYFYGSFDGDGHSVILNGFKDTHNSGWLGYYGYKAIVKNVTIYQDVQNATPIYSIAYLDCSFENVNMGDENVVGQTIECLSNNNAGFVQFNWAKTLTFKNCANYYNYASNVADTAVSPFISGYNDNTALKDRIAQTITFNNCANYGDLTAPHAGLLIGNDQCPEKITINIDGFVNVGKITGYTTGGIVGRNNSKNLIYSNSELIEKITGLEENTSVLLDPTMKLTLSNNKLVVTQASNENISKYVVTYNVYARYDRVNAEGNVIGTGTYKTTIEIALNPTFTNGKYESDLAKFKMMDKLSYVAQYGESKLPTLASGWTDLTSPNGKYFIDTTNNIIVVDYQVEGYIIKCNTTPNPILSALDENNNLLAVVALSK